MNKRRSQILLFSALCLFFCFSSATAQEKSKRGGKLFEDSVEAQNIKEMTFYLSRAKPAEKAEAVNAVYINGRTPLMFAVEEGNVAMAKLLVENGADVNMTLNGRCPFAAAAALESKRMIDYLDSTGKLNQESYNAALVEAAGPVLSARNPKERKENAERVKHRDNINLFKQIEAKSGGIKINEAELLMRAADNGNNNILKYLLSRGANPEAKDKNYGSTALFWAVCSLNIEAVKILLDAGANINAKNAAGITPLFFTIDTFEDKTAEASNMTMMKYLISRGADVNARASDGETPLSEACRIWNFNIVKTLTESGADVNAFSVLPFSVELKGTKILSYLISKGADVKSKSGAVALMTALNAENTEAAALLKKNGADAKTAGNRLPLKYRRFR